MQIVDIDVDNITPDCCLFGKTCGAE